jgi:hypothetical protein
VPPVRTKRETCTKGGPERPIPKGSVVATMMLVTKRSVFIRERLKRGA